MNCGSCQLDDSYCICEQNNKDNIQKRIAEALERIADALDRANPLIVQYASGYHAPSDKQNCFNHKSTNTGGFCDNCGEATL